MYFVHAHLTSPIGDSLDRQNIATLTRRFLEINSNRLKRTRKELNDRQHVFLDTLPILFHCNHPILPGYVSRTTPCGISGYQPTKDDVARAKALARSFCLKPSPNPQPDIWGIYVMGSVGTIAHNTRSDFDIWLCVRPGMSKHELDELNEKAYQISEWASKLRLEVHFFVMDCEEFKAGNLSTLDKESSGTAQRILLLDEFYRTSVFIAGRMPLWWYIPAGQESQYDSYVEKLLGQRYLPERDVIDFGGAPTIPEGEFMGAAVWQMYKAIESPYKSVLKLLLLEAYASQSPDISPLALMFKQSVYDGQPDINELDPYIMAYRRIESYLLEKNQLQRLELARRCLYYKINKPLSKTKVGQRVSWQRQHLKRLVEEWGWTANYIAFVDSRSEWNVVQVKKERAQLVNALNHTYRFLFDFATRQGGSRQIYITVEELNVLGRKLQAAFERRPGKIEWVNPGISKNIEERLVSISEYSSVEISDDQEDFIGDDTPSLEYLLKDGSNDEQSSLYVKRQTWFAYANREDEFGEEPSLRQGPSLVEILLWGYYNGVFTENTTFKAEIDGFNALELRRVMTTLRHWLPDIRPKLNHSAFQSAARPESILILINVATEDKPASVDQNVMRLSNRVDALNYGATAENLVQSIDLVVRNSWHEITSRRFDSKNALIDALDEYMAKCSPFVVRDQPEIMVECIGLSRHVIVASRIQELFESIIACYSPVGSAANRYVFSAGGKYHTLQFKDSQLKVRQYTDEKSLIAGLGEPLPCYSQIVLDSEVLIDHPVREITKHAQEKSVSIFYEDLGEGLDIYVIDVRGALVQLDSVLRDKKSTLTTLFIFIRSVIERLSRSTDSFMGECGVRSVRLFEIKRNRTNNIACLPRTLMQNDRANMLDIKAVGEIDERGRLCYSFYCDEMEFSWSEYGRAIFDVVARYIKRYRRSNETYPIFITDLDLDPCRYQVAEYGDLQLSHYLKVKKEIEVRLNNALSKHRIKK